MMTIQFMRNPKEKTINGIMNFGSLLINISSLRITISGLAIIFIISTQSTFALTSTSFPRAKNHAAGHYQHRHVALSHNATFKMNGNASFVFRLHNISDDVLRQHEVGDHFKLSDKLSTVLRNSLEKYLNHFFAIFNDTHDFPLCSVVKTTFLDQQIERDGIHKVLDVGTLLTYEMLSTLPAPSTTNKTVDNETWIEYTVCHLLNNPEDFGITETFISELRQQARAIDNLSIASSNVTVNETKNVFVSATIFFDYVETIDCFTNNGIYAYPRIKKNTTVDTPPKDETENDDKNLFTEDGKLNVLVVVYGAIICMPIVLAVIGLIVLECNLRRRIASGDVVPFTLPSVFDLSLFDEDESTFAVTDIGSDTDCGDSYKMQDSKAYEFEFTDNNEFESIGREHPGVRSDITLNNGDNITRARRDSKGNGHLDKVDEACQEIRLNENLNVSRNDEINIPNRRESTAFNHDGPLQVIMSGPEDDGIHTNKSSSD